MKKALIKLSFRSALVATAFLSSPTESVAQYLDSGVPGRLVPVHLQRQIVVPVEHRRLLELLLVVDPCALRIERAAGTRPSSLLELCRS